MSGVLPELPESWQWGKIFDIAESMKNGIYKPAKFYTVDGIACLRMYNIEKSKIVWKNIKRMNLTQKEIREYELKPYDILVNRVNSRELVGKAAMIPLGIEICVYESKNIRLRLKKKYAESLYITFWFQFFSQKYFNSNAQQTVGMASINQEQTGLMPVPLPPLPEQHRIVAKIEELFAKLDAGVAALEKVKAQLKRYRQSVLKYACEGKLTEKWREQNKGKIEPASVLLARILEERRKKWEEEQLAKMRSKGKEPKDDKWKQKYKEPAAPDTSDLPALPEEWCFTDVFPLFSLKRKGIKTGPFGSILKKHEHRDAGIPVLGIENISSMRFIFGSKIHISKH